MTLFKNTDRNLEGTANYSHEYYDYYNNSNRPEIISICNLLESWFSAFPEEEKAELKSRFKASFYSAFYELYIHALFTRLGYSLETHPEVEGTTKRPDYKAVASDGSFFFIEVKVIRMLSDKDTGLENRKNILFDSLNQIDASTFLLKLDEVVFKSASSPSGKLIVKHFNEIISRISPEEYERDLISLGYDKMPVIAYEDDKVKIALQLIPKAPQFRGEPLKAIGSHPSVMQIGDDSENLIGGLEKKSSRYGEFNAPYLICINKQSVGFNIIEFQQALYGTIEISYSNDPNNRDEKTGFSGNGFFGSRKNPKHTRVSAVYLTNANEGNLALTAGHALRLNPDGMFPLEIKMPKSIAEIFNLPANFPFESVTVDQA